MEWQLLPPAERFVLVSQEDGEWLKVWVDELGRIVDENNEPLDPLPVQWLYVPEPELDRR